jgi:hypothetical protein
LALGRGPGWLATIGPSFPRFHNPGFIGIAPDDFPEPGSVSFVQVDFVLISAEPEPDSFGCLTAVHIVRHFDNEFLNHALNS